jgi:endo-alpha-1,4-polygalactosaminidase (GH114 family)
MVFLPSLSRICGKYIDLLDGYDSKEYYVQYFGRAQLLLEKSKDGKLVFEVRARIDRTMLSRFAQFVNELSDNLERVLEEAEETLSTP